jgi:hypothetical protein
MDMESLSRGSKIKDRCMMYRYLISLSLSLSLSHYLIIGEEEEKREKIKKMTF